MTPRRNPYGLTLCPNGHLLGGPHHDGDVTGPPADPRGPTLGTRPPPPKRGALVHERPDHEQVLRHHSRLLSRVRHGGLDELAHRAGGSVRRVAEDASSFIHVL